VHLQKTRRLGFEPEPSPDGHVDLKTASVHAHARNCATPKISAKNR